MNDLLSKIAQALLVAVLASFLLGWAVQLLWNAALVPAINGVNSISYLQAVGIFFLTSLLFKSTTSNSSK